MQVADEGFDDVHQLSVILENLNRSKILGVLSREDLVGGAKVKAFEPPPIESVLNVYDIEEIAHACMKDTSWGYYATGSMDEFTK
jgi:hypothetical protein